MANIYIIKIYELTGGKMYENNGVFYEDAKIQKQQFRSTSIIEATLIGNVNVQ